VREFLQGMATQDLASATPDRAAQTLFLTEKGRPVALAWVVLDTDGASTWVIADEGARNTLRPHFERFRIMEDVEFEGPDGVPPVIGVAGPSRSMRALALAAENRGARAINADPLSFVLLGREAVPKEDAVAAVLPPPLRMPASAHTDAAEAWRISVGLPRTGVDFDLDRIATELSLPGAISDAKGCYVGQEVVARTSNRGQVRRHRVGFRFQWSGTQPPFRAELLAGGALRRLSHFRRAGAGIGRRARNGVRYRRIDRFRRPDRHCGIRRTDRARSLAPLNPLQRFT